MISMYYLGHNLNNECIKSSILWNYQVIEDLQEKMVWIQLDMIN
jgi:hypothetical protein